MNIAYAAGFFDGEGCVRIHNKTLCCKIAGAFRPGLLDLFIPKWGGKISKPFCPKNPLHKQSITWDIYGTAAMKFLEDIRPYCIEKKEQIDLAIRYQKIKIAECPRFYEKKHRSGSKYSSTKFSPEITEILLGIECNIKALKKIRYIYSKI